MVDSKGRRPHIRIVAILTDIGCQNMCRALTRCFDTVVTADAIARDVQVIEISGQPAGGRVAIITVVTAAYMGRMFAGSDNSVVARAAGPNNLSVVDGYGGHKSHRTVAVLADTGRLYVNRALARRGQTIVA